MDEKLTQIWRDKDARWRVIFIIVSAILSVVLAAITYDIKLTIAFIIVTAAIDVIVEVSKFINSTNFNLNRKLAGMNLANKLYLGFIIFYGMLVFYTFGLRIIDKTPFYSSINKIYPKGMLLCSGLF